MKHGFRIQQIEVLEDHANVFLIACSRFALTSCRDSPFSMTSPVPRRFETID